MAEFIPLSVPNFGPEEAANAAGAITSGWVSTSGGKVTEFEQALAGYVGMPRAVACNAGSSALHLAAMTAGIRRGDEVIVPTLTFIAAVNPLTRYVGAEPVFIGCDDSLCIDPDEVERFCAERCELRGGKLYNKTTGAHVAALEAVHVFGNMADLERLSAIARHYGLVLIEDATEALGSRYTSGALAGQFAGTVGDIGCYSFNGNKIITTGAGGMVVSNHADWAEHAKHLSTQAKADVLQFLHDEVGYNYRMTNVQACLGLAQLAKLEEFIRIKQARYAQYVDGLDGKYGLRILPFKGEAEGVRANHWFFSLYLKDSSLERDALIGALQAQGIQTRPVWALIHEQADYPRNEAYGLDKAVDYRNYIVNLPCSTNLTEQDCARVIDAVLALAK
ncbi:MAG: LegC family aminotransferase [Gemmiger sp.]